MKKRMLIVCLIVVLGGAFGLWRKSHRAGPPPTTAPAVAPPTHCGQPTTAAPSPHPGVPVASAHDNIPITPTVVSPPAPPALPPSQPTVARSGAGPDSWEPAFIRMTEPIWHPGKDAVASITTANGQTIAGLRLNQVNAFEPRVNIQPVETVTVTVAWPQGTPGDTVVAAVEDGGALGNAPAAGAPAQTGDQRVLKLALNDQRQVSFVFTSSNASGLFRVTLRKGADVKTVELWAGPEPALAATAK